VRKHDLPAKQADPSEVTEFVHPTPLRALVDRTTLPGVDVSKRPCFDLTFMDGSFVFASARPVALTGRPPPDEPV
jgi:hypothetical protein